MSDENNNNEADTVSAKKGLRSASSFPMASFLIAGALRPHVVTFFAFARELDDLSDNTDIMPGDKLARMSAMEAVLLGEASDPSLETSLRMAASLKVTGISNTHCLNMVEAAKQDATKSRYETWDELLDYCRCAAVPIGRYLLDLHGENKKIYPLTDVLCSALQIINHIQDCREDFINLDRVYIPQDILTKYAVPLTDLEQKACSPSLRGVIDVCLDRVDELLEQAALLPEVHHGLNEVDCALVVCLHADVEDDGHP